MPHQRPASNHILKRTAQNPVKDETEEPPFYPFMSLASVSLVHKAPVRHHRRNSKADGRGEEGYRPKRPA